MTDKQGTKRTVTEALVDPDTGTAIENAKRPKIELDKGKKYSCLASIVEMYECVLKLAFEGKADTFPTPMATGSKATDTLIERAQNNITVGNHIISIIFTIHNIHRQKAKGGKSTMEEKSDATSFKVRFMGNDYPMVKKDLYTNWIKILAGHHLEYKDFSNDDKTNWYGTMGPYLDMFAAYALRANELRLGHNNMPMSKKDGTHKSFPVSKYGLSGAHHVLLEGTSFPPERRSSIVQSLGPMTAWLCMVRSDGIYRKKYAAAVKRAMSHIPCIDEIIEITKTVKIASEISTLTLLIAEILLVTTARQATRMFFPITIFAHVWNKEEDVTKFCEEFSTTGRGGWYAYKQASTSKNVFTISGNMEEEKASQVVFHSIFGTYKEDFGVLASITTTGQWFTREQLGDCFKQQGTTGSVTKIQLPRMKVYSKMSYANQSGMLSGVYNQVASVPCFSGQRVQLFDSNFFEHIAKKKAAFSGGKSLNQLISTLTTTLNELHENVKVKEGKIKMGTTKWFDMETLTLEEAGNPTEISINATGRMFLGKI